MAPLGLGFFFCLAGRVGKTSLTLKYVNNIFDENQESSTNASFFEKVVQLPLAKKTVAIWVHFQRF
jgi:Ras-related protein Rab-21